MFPQNVSHLSRADDTTPLTHLEILQDAGIEILLVNNTDTTMYEHIGKPKSGTDLTTLSVSRLCYAYRIICSKRSYPDICLEGLVAKNSWSPDGQCTSRGLSRFPAECNFRALRFDDKSLMFNKSLDDVSYFK
jgi:hypothetical protein